MNVFIAVISGNQAELGSEESWHCAKVLRCRSGEAVTLIDGKGNYFDGVLELVTDRKCLARITGGPRSQPRRSYRLHLAIAPTKQMDRIEWMVEKAVEIGVDELSFVVCRNSERKTIREDRLEKIVESAVKQSLQAYVPAVNGMISLKEFVSGAQADVKLVAHCGSAERRTLKQLSFENKQVIAIVGPEGDFTTDEVELAAQHGFVPVTLGQNRLRTETAGLYLVQALSLFSN
jgi:16S rRNA (uracil1498-N3)-methyltransferase